MRRKTLDSKEEKETGDEEEACEGEGEEERGAEEEVETLVEVAPLGDEGECAVAAEGSESTHTLPRFSRRRSPETGRFNVEASSGDTCSRKRSTGMREGGIRTIHAE